jgi:hypothetical protein
VQFSARCGPRLPPMDRVFEHAFSIPNTHNIPFISRHNCIYCTIGAKTINKLVYFLLIYGIIGLILTILVNDQVIYVTIDAIVSFWSYVFFVFNPFPMLYRAALVLQYGPSVWINSATITVILFIYPIIIIAIGLILFRKYRG